VTEDVVVFFHGVQMKFVRRPFVSKIITRPEFALDLTKHRELWSRCEVTPRKLSKILKMKTYTMKSISKPSVFNC
jgi:hypothetical protein